MANGWITIGTKLDNSKFDRDITKLEKQIEKEESKKLTIETQLSLHEEQLKRERENADKLGDAYQRILALKKTIEQGKASPEQYTELSSLQNQYGTLEQIGNSLDKSVDKQDALEMKVDKTKQRYSEINNKVQELKDKIDTVSLQKQQQEVENLKGKFTSVGSEINKSFKSTLKTVTRVVLGVIGIRAAISALRTASSQLQSYDPQYKANIDYIRYALTNAIAPVLRWIVSMVATILGYINAIAQAWFSINIFGNASAKSFSAMQSSAGGTAASVRQIKKDLAGFDEMNVLSDQDTSGGGGRRWSEVVHQYQTSTYQKCKVKYLNGYNGY